MDFEPMLGSMGLGMEEPTQTPQGITPHPLDPLLSDSGIPLWDLPTPYDAIELMEAVVRVTVLSTMGIDVQNAICNALPPSELFAATLRRYARLQASPPANSEFKQTKDTIEPDLHLFPFYDWHTTNLFTPDLSEASRNPNLRVTLQSCKPSLNLGKINCVERFVIGPKTKIEVQFVREDSAGEQVKITHSRTAADGYHAAMSFEHWTADTYADLRSLWVHPQEHNLTSLASHPNPPISLPLLPTCLIDRLLKEIQDHKLHVGDMTRLRKLALNPHSLPLTTDKRPFGLCLYGPPGTNKSSMANLLMHGVTVSSNGQKVKIPLRPIWGGTSSEWSRPHPGETEEIISFLANRSKATPHVLSAIFVDEIDVLTRKRSTSTSEHSVAWLSHFLRIMDSSEYNRLFWIGTTNLLNQMDEAVLRPGRLEVLCYFPRLLPAHRIQLLQSLLSHAPSVELTLPSEDKLSRMTLNWSGRLISHLASTLRTTYLLNSPIQALTLEQVEAEIEELIRCSPDPNVAALPVADLEHIVQARLAPIRDLVSVSASENMSNSFSGAILVNMRQWEVEARRQNGFSVARNISSPTPRSLANYLACDLLQASTYYYVDSKRLGHIAASTSEAGAGDGAAILSSMVSDAESAGFLPGGRSVIVFDLDNLVGPSDSITHQHGTGGDMTSSTFTIQRRALFQIVMNLIQSHSVWSKVSNVCMVAMIDHPALLQEAKNQLKWTLRFEPLPHSLYDQYAINMQGSMLNATAANGVALLGPLTIGIHYLEVTVKESSNFLLGVVQHTPGAALPVLMSSQLFWGFDGTNRARRHADAELAINHAALEKGAKVGIMFERIPGGNHLLALYIDGRFVNLMFTGLPDENMFFAIGLKMDKTQLSINMDASPPSTLPAMVVDPPLLTFGNGTSVNLEISDNGRMATHNGSKAGYAPLVGPALRSSGTHYFEWRLDQVSTMDRLMFGFSMSAPWTLSCPGYAEDSFGILIQNGLEVFHNSVRKHRLPAPPMHFKVGDHYGLLMDYEDTYWNGAAFLLYRAAGASQANVVAVIAHGLLSKFPAKAFPHFYPIAAPYSPGSRLTVISSASIGDEKNTALQIKLDWMTGARRHLEGYGMVDGMTIEDRLCFKCTGNDWQSGCMQARPAIGQHYFEVQLQDHMSKMTHMMMGFSFGPCGGTYPGSSAPGFGFGFHSYLNSLLVYCNGIDAKTLNPLVLAKGDSYGVLLDFNNPYWNGAAFAFVRNGTSTLRFAGLITSGLCTMFPRAQFPFFYPQASLCDINRHLVFSSGPLQEALQVSAKLWSSKSTFALDLSQTHKTTSNVISQDLSLQGSDTPTTIYAAALPKPAQTLPTPWVQIQLIKAGTSVNWRVGLTPSAKLVNVPPGSANGFNIGVNEDKQGKWRIYSANQPGHYTEHAIPRMQPLDRICIYMRPSKAEVNVYIIAESAPNEKILIASVPIPDALLNNPSTRFYPAVFLGDTNCPIFRISAGRP